MYTHGPFGEGEIEFKYDEIFLALDKHSDKPAREVIRLYEEKVCLIGAALLVVAEFAIAENHFEKRAVSKQAEMIRLGSQYVRENGQAQVVVTEVKEGDPLFDLDYYRLRLGSDTYGIDELLRYGYKALNQPIEIINKTEHKHPNNTGIDELALRRIAAGNLQSETLHAIAGQ